MSKAMVCDQCGTVLVVNDRGDDANGDSAAWIVLETAYRKYDLCSRACVHALVDDEDFEYVYEDGIAAVAAVTRTINGEDE